LEHAGELPLAEDEHMIAALAAHAPQEALAHRIRPRGAGWRAQERDAAGRSHPRERRPEFAVVVADEVLRVPVERGGPAQLLRDPGVGRVSRRADMHHAPHVERDDEGGEERAEEQIGDREEVAGPHVGGVIAQEGGPRLPARERSTVAGQVGPDGALGDAQPQLQEFAADAFGPPRGFSSASRRIRVTVAASSGGRPGPGRDFRRQSARTRRGASTAASRAGR